MAIPILRDRHQGKNERRIDVFVPRYRLSRTTCKRGYTGEDKTIPTHKPQALGLILVGPVLSVDVANASLHTDWHWPISHVGCSPLAGKALCLALFGS